MILNGFIDSVSLVRAGGSLREDETSGSTVLAVDDAVDFDEIGGAVEINGTVYNYVTADLDSDDNTLTLATGLIEDLQLGQPIYVAPDAPEKRASVILADNGDTLDVRVPHSLFDRIPEGIRDNQARESVTVDVISGEWTIVDVIGKQPSIDGSYIDPQTVPAQPTDGQPPMASPVPTAIGGLGSVFLMWTAIENADPVTYEVHVSTTENFTEDSSTLLTETVGRTLNVRALPDGSAFAYGVTYYFRVVARDVDGSADASDDVPAQVMQVNSPDIAANYIYGGQVSANQFVGGEITADLTLSSTIKTADTGARAELSALGLLITDSTGSPTTILGTDGENYFKGNVEANGLTVNGGATFRSATNELSRAAVMTLAAGITNSTNPPSVQVDWEKVELQKPGGGATWPTPGNLRGLSRTPDGKWMSADSTGGFHKWNPDGTWVSSTDGVTGLTHVTQPVSGGPVYGMQINGATASISRLTEDPVFTDSFSGTLSGWPASSASGAGTYGIVSGKAQLTAPTGTNSARIERTLEGSFRTRAVQMNVAVTSGFPVGDGVHMEIGSNTENTYFRMRIDGSNFIIEWTLNAAWDFVPLTYNPTQHAWWKIYELNGRMNFQTSPDGLNWTTQATVSHGRSAAALTGMYWNFSATAGDTGSNLISNPGFETNTAGWTPLSGATITRSTSDVSAGVASAILAKPSQNDNVQMNYQPIPVTAGRNYTAYGFAKGYKATNLSSYIEFNWYDANGSWLGGGAGNETTINDSSDTFVTATKTAPAGATSVVLTYATYDFSTSSWNAKTRWDSMRLYDATAATVIATADDAKYYGVVGSLPTARINTAQSPALGSYTTTGDLLLAEFDDANNRFVVKRITPADMSTVVSTFTGASNAAFSGTLAGVLRGNFDFPEERYVFSVQGSAGTNWWSFKNSDGSYMNADNFPVINGGHQGMGYDGTNFWALGSDAYLNKHTNLKWVAGTDSASWQVGFTWYDGGTQETTPSPYANVTMKMRARLTVTSSALPYTSAGDPDRIRVYIGRGGGTKFRQGASASMSNTLTLTTATFSGTAAPTTGTFASATPAKIRNTDDSLIISADGSIKAKTLDVTDNPYWYGYIATAQTLTSSTSNVDITGWVADGSSNIKGITVSAGVVTVPKAGRYKITAQMSFAGVAGGRRYLQVFSGSAGNTVYAFGFCAGSNVGVNQVHVSKTIRMNANDSFRCTVSQNSGVNVDTVIGQAFSFFQVEYVGP